MLTDRRTMLRTMGAAATLSLAAPLPVLAKTGPRVFDLYRGNSRIGRQTLEVTRAGGKVNVAVDISIKVRILGIPAYSYELSSREVWANGALEQLNASGNDNGTATRVSALRTAAGLQVDGSAWKGTLTDNPATTTYWSQAFLNRGTWLSTQDGRPMRVSASRGGAVKVPTPEGPVPATRYKVRGDIGRLDLFYDANGEWIGNEFDARGEQARFVLAARGRDIAGLF